MAITRRNALPLHRCVRTCGARGLCSSAAILLLAGVWAVAAFQSAGAEETREKPVLDKPVLDAASLDVDYKTKTTLLKDVVISQGNTRVRADRARANSLDFENSRWTFDGNVRIDAEPRGNLRSNQAIVEFQNNRIAKATISGTPAEFEQKRADSDQVARGHADEIVYDVNDGTVRLSNDAWLSDGQHEISGPLLVYNIRAERVQATSPGTTDERVHIKIAPRGNPGSDNAGPNGPRANTPGSNNPSGNNPGTNNPGGSNPGPNDSGPSKPAPNPPEPKLLEPSRQP